MDNIQFTQAITELRSSPPTYTSSEFMAAFFYNDLNSMKQIWDHAPFDLNAWRNREDKTTLLFRKASIPLEILQWLVDHGADPTIPNVHGFNLAEHLFLTQEDVLNFEERLDILLKKDCSIQSLFTAEKNYQGFDSPPSTGNNYKLSYWLKNYAEQWAQSNDYQESQLLKTLKKYRHSSDLSIMEIIDNLGPTLQKKQASLIDQDLYHDLLSGIWVSIFINDSVYALRKMIQYECFPLLNAPLQKQNNGSILDRCYFQRAYKCLRFLTSSPVIRDAFITDIQKNPGQNLLSRKIVHQDLVELQKIGVDFRLLHQHGLHVFSVMAQTDSVEIDVIQWAKRHQLLDLFLEKNKHNHENVIECLRGKQNPIADKMVRFYETICLLDRVPSSIKPKNKRPRI